MSQVNSGYKRRRRDAYHTPAWVTQALLPHLPRRVKHIREPAAGSDDIVKVLRAAGFRVRTSDIKTGQDFLKMTASTPSFIVTNPPYSCAEDFIEHALELTMRHSTGLAMLLRIDFDSAKTRRHLFAEHPAFARKVVLLNRIRWIKNSTGSPSENHAWYVWNWKHKGKPIIVYSEACNE